MIRASSNIKNGTLNNSSNRVLLLVQQTLQANGYHVLRYNSRGVGRSTGWASFTGFSEAKDLEALVQWALEELSEVHSLVLAVSIAAYQLFIPLKVSAGLFSWLPDHLVAPCHTHIKDFTYPDIISSWPQRLAYPLPYKDLYCQTEGTDTRCQFQRAHLIWRSR